MREAAYQRLKDTILAGGFAAGGRLVEQDIAQRLRVSRTPVRDALRRLEAEGIVQALPKGGLVVREYSDAEVEEIYRIREALEGLAAEYAARNATARDLERLESLSVRLQRYAENPEADVNETIAAHRNFSDACIEACRMPALLRMLRPLLAQIALIRSITMRSADRRAAAHQEHQELFEALKARDGLRAAELARAHARNALQEYQNRQPTEVAEDGD